MSLTESLTSNLPFPSSISLVTPTQNPSTTMLGSGPYIQPEPFPSALLAAGSGTVVVAVGVAVLLFWKRRGVVKP